MIEDFKHMKWLPLAGGALLCVLGLTAPGSAGPGGEDTASLHRRCNPGLGLCEVASGFLAKSFLPEYIPGMRKLQGFVNVAVGLSIPAQPHAFADVHRRGAGRVGSGLRRAAPEGRAAAACVRPAMGLLCG